MNMQVTDAAVIAMEMGQLATDTGQLELISAREHRMRNSETDEGVRVEMQQCHVMTLSQTSLPWS